MPLFKDPKLLQKHLSASINASKGIGFVPTMGALHEGHLSLIKTALSQNSIVVVSIFVNPTQFGDQGDLVNYPRTLSKDEALIKSLHPDIIIFTPSAKALYGNEVKAKTYNFGAIANEMVGRYRQGHFDGVGTVLELLFDIIKPDRAYFGEKDFQQLQIVKKLVSITKQPVEVIGCPIHREENGLAMSSRNERLSSQERSNASFIYKTLQEAKNKFKSQSVPSINAWVKEQFAAHGKLNLEYFEIANAKTLKTIKRKRKNTAYRAFIAAFSGDVRLIDNIALNY